MPGIFGGLGGFGGAVAGAAAAAAAGQGQGGGFSGFGAGSQGQFSGGRMPGIAGGQAIGSRGLAGTTTGNFGLGSQGQFSSGPMGTGPTGNALINSALNNDFTTPYSAQDAISVVSPTLGQLAGLLGLGNVMSTGPAPPTASDSGVGVGRLPTLINSQPPIPRPITPSQPTVQQPNPIKKYKNIRPLEIPGWFDPLSGGSQMTNLQRRLATATFGGPLDYYSSILNQDLIDPSGGVRTGAEVFPAEYDYLRKRGLNVNFGDINSIADALYA